MASEQTTFIISDRCVTTARYRRIKTGWHLEDAVAVRIDAPPALTPQTDLSDYVEPMVTLARHIGADQRPSRLLIPGTWIFTHRITPAGRRRDPNAVAFALEEFLPLPLEELTCTALPLPDGEMLGLAVATQPLRDLLDRLAEQSVHIDAIELDVLAACESLPIDESEYRGLVWRDRHHLSIATIDRQRQLNTYRTVRLTASGNIDQELATRLPPDCDESITWHVISSGPVQIAECGLRNADWENNSTTFVDSPIPLPFKKVGAANLRVGALAFGGRWNETYRHVTRAVAMLAILLTLAAANFHRQRTAAERVTDTLGQTECEQFVEIFAGRPCPPGVTLRVASERIRLEGLTRSAGRAEAADSTVEITPLLDTLRDIAAAIPDDVRLFVQDLRIDERHLALQGTARRHTEAEQIAKALRKIPGLVPAPPRSDARKPGGVNFSLHAKRGTGNAG